MSLGVGGGGTIRYLTQLVLEIKYVVWIAKEILVAGMQEDMEVLSCKETVTVSGPSNDV